MGHLLRFLEFSGWGRKPAFMKGLPREKRLSPPKPCHLGRILIE